MLYLAVAVALAALAGLAVSSGSAVLAGLTAPAQRSRRAGSAGDRAAAASPYRPGRLTAALTSAAAGSSLALFGDRLVGDSGLALLEAGLLLLLVAALIAAPGRPGLILLAAGLATNLTVITLDRGMPVSGLPPSAPGAAHHHGLSRRDRLPELGDGIRLGAETLSPGDVAAIGGIAVATFTAVTRRRARPTRRSALPPPASPPQPAGQPAPPAGRRVHPPVGPPSPASPSLPRRALPARLVRGRLGP